jgi:WD40 repeat protein
MKKSSFILTACCLLILASLACGVGGGAPTEEAVDAEVAEEPGEPTEAPAESAPTETPIPPTPVPEPTEGPPYEGPIPEGARARIGRGIAASMSLSPDGEFLAIGSSIGVYLYRTDFMVSDWFAPVSSPVVGTVFSPDGSKIAALTGSYIYILDTATGEWVGERISSSSVDGVAVFSPDGMQLVTPINQTIRLWDLSTGEIAAELEGHSKSVQSLAWTPDGSQLVSGATGEDGETGEIIVWDPASGEIVRQFGAEHSRAITALVFNSDGSKLLSDAAKEAIIWDFASGTPEATIESTHFSSAAWSPDDSLIAFGLNQGRTAVYDAASAAELYQVEDQRITILDVAFSPDSSLLYTLDSDGTIYQRDAATGQMQRAIEGFTGRLGTGVWSPDGTTIWAGMSGEQIVHWDVGTFERLHLYGDFGAGGLTGFTVEAIAYSPDFSLIAVGGPDGRIQLYDPAADEVIAAFGDRETGHTSGINSLNWSSDGTQIVTGAFDNAVIVWDVEAQQPLGRFDSFSERGFGDVLFAPDGSAIVVAGWDDFIYVLDAASGAVKNKWNPDQGDQSDLDWHPTEPNQFVTASMEITIWDYATGEPVLIMEEADGFDFPYSVAFSPDGSLIVGGGSNGDVAIWDAATGSLIAVYEEPHTDTVNTVAFSPDGTVFATISDDGTIVIWDTP